jgi:hypothetical protein
MKIQMHIRLLFLAFVLGLTSCSEAPTPQRPWQGFATSRKTGQIEWFFPLYISLDDCKFKTKQLIESGVESQWYRSPSGCLYNGYQNPYVQWVVNRLVAGDSFKCIARLIERETIYAPVLKDYPLGDKGENWYCVLSNLK